MAKDEFTILVLGPMPVYADKAVRPDEGTIALSKLVPEIVEALKGKEPDRRDLRVTVDSPDHNRRQNIIAGVLDKIENADLAIIDLTGGSPNVHYELGIVNALGMPYIVVTKEQTVSFYFRNFQYIAGLEANQRFDPQLSAHWLLYDKLRAFLTSAPETDFAENPVTSYFQLPIIDISGPSGLATGYYINAISRFVRSNGFFDSNCDVILTDPLPAGAPPDAKPATRTGQMAISDFIAVQPPSLMKDSFRKDDEVLRQALAGLGLGRRSVVVLKRKDEPADLRNYAGDFLVRLEGPQAGDFVSPGIVIEIPTTLYALPYAPRLRRLPPSRDALRLRRLRAMLDSFEAVMTQQVQTANNPQQEGHFHFVPLDKLEAKLREVKVL